MAKRHFALVVLAVAALTFVSCDDAPETGRSIVTILNFNNGTPVQSDVLFDDGTSSYIPEDLVPIELTARPYNKFITGVEHANIVVERYHIRWTRTDGGTGNLPERDEASHITIMWNTKTDAAIRLTTWQDKTGPVLSPLVGTSNTIGMRADITFFAREVGTTAEIEFATSISVNFADAVND